MQPSQHRHKHNNLALLIITSIIFVILVRNEVFKNYLLTLGGAGYLGAFIAGALFVSTFTVAIGAVILFTLAQNIPAIQIGIIAGAGAVIGNLIIFKFVKDDLYEDIKPLYDELGGKHLTNLLHTKYFSWSIPVIGALLIISPLPDELGVTLLGLSKMSTTKFLVLCFILNTIGISLLVSTANLLRP